MFDKLTETISKRYKQQSLEDISSREQLLPSDLRRVAADVGFALIAVIIIEYTLQQLIPIFVRLFYPLTGGDDGLIMLMSYILSDCISYLPKILAFGILYKKYRVLNGINNQYENRPYYAVLVIPAMFAFGIWGSKITTVINYVFTLLFGTEEIDRVLDSIAPSGFSEAVVVLIFVSFAAPVAEEFIYRHLLLRSLRPLGDTPAIIVSALIFGLAHGNFDQFLYAFLIGIILGLLAVRYDSIIPSMVLHFLNNFFVTVVNYKDSLMCGNDIWDTLVMCNDTIGTTITTISYFLAPFTAIALAFCGMARLVPVQGEDKYKKLCTVFSPMLVIPLSIMLIKFFL